MDGWTDGLGGRVDRWMDLGVDGCAFWMDGRRRFQPGNL